MQVPGAKINLCQIWGSGGGLYLHCTELTWEGIWLGGTDTRDDMLFLPMSGSCIKRICLKTYHILEEEGT